MTEDDKEALQEFLIGVLNVALMTAFFLLIIVMMSLL